MSWRSAMRASVLIKLLQEAIREYGDREVFVGGEDYPSGVGGISYREKGDAYVHAKSFKIYNED